MQYLMSTPPAPRFDPLVRAFSDDSYCTTSRRFAREALCLVSPGLEKPRARVRGQPSAPRNLERPVLLLESFLEWVGFHVPDCGARVVVVVDEALPAPGAKWGGKRPTPRHQSLERVQTIHLQFLARCLLQSPHDLLHVVVVAPQDDVPVPREDGEP